LIGSRESPLGDFSVVVLLHQVVAER
jgi:hypothetical protein